MSLRLLPVSSWASNQHTKNCGDILYHFFLKFFQKWYLVYSTALRIRPSHRSSACWPPRASGCPAEQQSPSGALVVCEPGLEQGRRKDVDGQIATVEHAVTGRVGVRRAQQEDLGFQLSSDKQHRPRASSICGSLLPQELWGWQLGHIPLHCPQQNTHFQWGPTPLLETAACFSSETLLALAGPYKYSGEYPWSELGDLDSRSEPDNQLAV